MAAPSFAQEVSIEPVDEISIQPVEESVMWPAKSTSSCLQDSDTGDIYYIFQGKHGRPVAKSESRIQWQLKKKRRNFKRRRKNLSRAERKRLRAAIKKLNGQLTEITRCKEVMNEILNPTPSPTPEATATPEPEPTITPTPEPTVNPLLERIGQPDVYVMSPSLGTNTGHPWKGLAASRNRITALVDALPETTALDPAREILFILDDGHHGAPLFRDLDVPPNVTLRFISFEPYWAEVDRIYVNNSNNLIFEQLTVQNVCGGNLNKRLVDILGVSNNISLIDNKIHSALEDDYLDWDLATWNNMLCSGALVRGDDHSFINNQFEALYRVFQGTGDRITLRGNSVHAFSSDAIKAYGDDWHIVGNLFTRSMDIGTSYKGKLIYAWLNWNTPPGNNWIIEKNLYSVFGGAYSAPMEGIIIPRGGAQDWRVENNILDMDTVNGFSAFGISGFSIYNNLFTESSVVVNNYKRSGVEIASTNNEVNLNIAVSYEGIDDSSAGGNVELGEGDRDKYFTDPENLDFTYTNDAPFYDKGTVGATDTILGGERPTLKDAGPFN